jgi:Fe-S oxidoreductase
MSHWGVSVQAKQNFLGEYQEQVLKCSKCGFCQAACPVFLATLRPAYNARGKILILKAILDGTADLTKDLCRTFYLCTECQSCAISCPSGVKGNEIVEVVRKELCKRGFTPSALGSVRKAVFKVGNVFTSRPDDRIEIYPPQLKDRAKAGRLPKNAETLLFMGCLASYMDMKIVPSFVRLMETSGVAYTTLANDEICCGLPLFLMGTEDFVSYATALAEYLRSLGVREMITPCAGCYRTFKNLYPEIGQNLGMEIYHTVHYLDKLVGEKRLNFRKRISQKITYHDPCDLGRACQVFEEPRNLLRQIPGVELVEMENNRMDALCCGAGGGMAAVDPDLSVEMAAARVRQALAVGAEVILSGCPACKDNLRKGSRTLPKEERGKIKIMDIVEITAQVVG